MEDTRRLNRGRSRNCFNRAVRREASRSEGQSTVPERSGAQGSSESSGAVSPAPFIEDDLRPTDVKERPGALAAAHHGCRGVVARYPGGWGTELVAVADPCPRWAPAFPGVTRGNKYRIGGKLFLGCGVGYAAPSLGGKSRSNSGSPWRMARSGSRRVQTMSFQPTPFALRRAVIASEVLPSEQ